MAGHQRIERLKDWEMAKVYLQRILVSLQYDPEPEFGAEGFEKTNAKIRSFIKDMDDTLP